MAEIAISVLAKIAEYTVAPIGRQFGYLFCYNDNIKKLINEDGKLEAKRRVVEQKVEAANNNCQTIREDVEKWLSSVISEKKKVDTILEDKEKLGKGCLNEWCINLKSRHYVSRRAAKKSKDLVTLLTEGEKFNEVAGAQQPLGIVPQQTPIVVGDSISEADAPVLDQIGGTSSGGLDSRLSFMRDVMKAVKDNKIRMIGICGMGGVGKTTMVKEVERLAKLDNSMFDEVVMTAVSKDPDVKKIQDDIAELLGLEFKEHNPWTRAVRLRDRLTQKGSNGKPKRILIILDDVWNKINLEEVGIPCEDSDHNGCKIMLTSRDKNVCDEMKTKTFSVKLLPKPEARSLFQKINDYSSNLNEIANDIVKECGGLPLAITNIASVLLSKGESTWKDVHRQLKKSALEGDYAVVYKSLELSYYYLDTKDIKDFFLLCCLFPEDYDILIEDLARYGMALWWFKSIDNLHDARNRAHAYVEKLKNSNLLLGGRSKEFVKMHDLMRDVALSLTTNVFMVRFDNRLTVWPTDTCEYCTSISLQCDKFHELPDGLNYQNLKLLRLVKRNASGLKFPERFYEGMEKLQVLALTSMPIQSLPGSLKLLTSLRTLSLDYCKFIDDISMIENLVNLEILSLVESDIKELPREIGKLTRLRLLDLTRCPKLRKIARGVLPSLISLEELYMMGSSFRWAQQAYVDDGTNASFEELKQLSNLVSIEIDIPYEVLPIDLNLENLQNFKISIAGGGGGGDLRSDFQFWIENSLKLKADRSVLLVSVFEVLCRKTEVLYLRVKDLKNLPTKLERDGFFKLRSLEFESCNELVSIVNLGSNWDDMCRGQHSKQDVNIPSSSRHQLAPFGNLQDLKLGDCNKLKNIFPVCIARVLIKLKSLEIKQCQMMEEIFFKERGDEGKIEFPHLIRLHLEELPNLIGFCKAVEEVELPRLIYLCLSDLPKLTSLYPDETETLASEHPFFNKKVTLNKVSELKVSRMENLIEIWPASDSISELRHIEVDDCERGTHIIRGFQNLTYVTVERCERLKTVFSPSIARRLVSLQSLIIVDCQMMESILSNENGAAVPPYKIEFPDLEQLHLEDLPNLVCFSKSGDGVELPQLEELEIINVPKFGGLYPEETVTVASDRHYAASPNNPFFNSKVTLTNLATLKVSRMDHLTTCFPALVIQQLHNLDYLFVDNCSSVEVVFDLQGLNVNEGRELVLLSRLKMLCLSGLPSLTHVWKKGPHIIHGFQNLTTLTVEECDSLMHLFTPSVAKILVALDDLHISECMLLEAIVTKEEEEEEAEEEGILFPRLTMLDLRKLPNLLTPTLTWLKWSSLKKLTVIDCNGNIGQQVTGTKVAKQEELGMENLNEISPAQCDTQVSTDATNCEKQILTLFPTNVVQQLHNLESLDVWIFSSIEVVFDLQGLHVNEQGSELAALTQLRTVELKRLPKLTHVCKKSVHITQGFQNLISLEISSCDSLKHVFTYSMAKILVGLKKLIIVDCMLLEAIVAKEEGKKEHCTAKEGILLPHLTNLKLHLLPNLSTIMPGPYAFNSSSSTDLTVNDILRQGDTAQQDKLVLYVCQMDNLITVFPALVIQQLHNLGEVSVHICSSVEVVFDLQGLNVNEGREVVPLTRLEKLDIYALPKLTRVWKKGPHIIHGFQKLTTLNVVECDSLMHLFTPSVAKILVALEDLYIGDCMLLEAIVTKEEEEEEGEAAAEEGIFLFPQLTRLSLSRLPNLLTIIPKPYTFNWSFLEHCDVNGCGRVGKRLNVMIRNRNTAR